MLPPSACWLILISLVWRAGVASASGGLQVVGHVPDTHQLATVRTGLLSSTLVLVLIQLSWCALIWMLSHDVLHHLCVATVPGYASDSSVPVPVVPVFARLLTLALLFLVCYISFLGSQAVL